MDDFDFNLSCVAAPQSAAKATAAGRGDNFTATCEL
jgi:hypothetical protein